MVHEDGDPHGTVHIWVIREKEQGFDVLLQKRSAHKDSFPGCYDISSAGHMVAGDDYLETAVRELEEELGIHATENQLQQIGVHHGIIKDVFYGREFFNHEISAVYIYKEPVEIENLKLQKEEVESVRWVDYEECKKKMKSGELKHCIFEDEFEMLEKK